MFLLHSKMSVTLTNARQMSKLNKRMTINYFKVGVKDGARNKMELKCSRNKERSY